MVECRRRRPARRGIAAIVRALSRCGARAWPDTRGAIARAMGAFPAARCTSTHLVRNAAKGLRTAACPGPIGIPRLMSARSHTTYGVLVVSGQSDDSRKTLIM